MIDEKEILIPTNEFQTEITQELLNNYPEEIQEWFMDAVTNIPFIKNLISPSRRRAKDMPKDKDGRIIIDFENPHIIEDADYFRPAALFYMQHGCYTLLKPNSNPQSEYKKFWTEERRRIREGYVRESDGEWVTGFCYWFLNYTPMMVNIIREGTNTADRVESFPFFFEGIYWRFHYLYHAKLSGKHAIELAKRGCAKSYSLASIMTHNLFHGESEISKKRVTTVLTAYEKEYLKDEKDGTFAKFTPMLDFVRTNTPFPRLMLKNSPNDMSWQMGYKDATGATAGNRNTVLGVSAKDNPDKLRGKRGWILFEEMGTFKGLLPLYDTTRKSVEEGNYAFACMYLVGTSNEKESSFESAKILLYHTQGYRIYTIKNVFDKVGTGRDTFGFFFPAYINRAGCYNKDGVSDVVKALFEIFQARYTAKYGTDPNSLLRTIAEDPITPAEAIIKVKDAFFPVTALNERLMQIESNPSFFDDVYIGNLVFNTSTNKVEYRVSDDIPIRKYGVENTTPGAIEFYEMPILNSEGKVPYDRYIIGHDPVDNDQAESSSLTSTFVFDLWTDRIVAEYTGRQNFADSNFEIVRLLCLFYNAKCLFESNKKGIFSYFQRMNSTHLLAETPDYLRERELIKYSNFGSNRYGVNANAAINNFANGLIRDWLLKEVTMYKKDEHGEDMEVTMPMLYTLKNKALIEELVAFNPINNFDRIRALGMVMLYREEKMILYGNNIGERKDEYDASYMGNDDYFKKNYDDRAESPLWSKNKNRRVY